MRLNNIRVPGNNLKVTANLRIDSDDLSGQTSGTDRNHKGFKPKTLNCSLLVKKAEADQLTRLLELVESLDESGKQTVYTIVDPLAQAMKIRQVQFMDNFAAREAESQHAWNVSFTLVEHLSVPEKIEQRQEATPVTQQAAQGDTVAVTAEATTEVRELTGFESVLKWVDELFA